MPASWPASARSQTQIDRAVITPHADDIARLLNVDSGAVEANPLAPAQRAAERHGCVVMMKGAQSRIVSPFDEPWLYGGSGVGLAPPPALAMSWQASLQRCSLAAWRRRQRRRGGLFA